MRRKEICERVSWLGAIDWDRRLFDSLIPLPDGTSYNAYLVEGSEKIALIDTVDPPLLSELMCRLENVPKIDYIISQHGEQDHSGGIPQVLKCYPNAKVVTTPKGKPILMDLLHLPEEIIVTVADGESLSLGDKTLTFMHTPWVHWPETMVTYLKEDKILFTCDFLGSHIASSSLFVNDQCQMLEASKRYFAEIMMPFRSIIEKNLEKIQALDIAMIAPSHGQIHDQPAVIIDAYRDWVSGPPKNTVVIPYVSMHESTQQLVKRLVASLAEHGVQCESFNLAVTDIGKLAMSLIDAATIVVGTPTVLAGPHPLAAYATLLANALRPKAKFLSVIGSYCWGGKAVETLSGMIPNLKVEVIEPIMIKGAPRQADFESIDKLAATIAAKHKENGYL